MKKIIKIQVIFWLSFILSSCEIIYMDVPDIPPYWINPVTHDVPSDLLRDSLWDDAVTYAHNDVVIAWDYYGKELYQKGFRFYEVNRVYCSKNKKYCHIMRKYK